jgi:2-polyprenyl-3-methyl-5-hydroxy-6-metoxy-1,4-benzoquinol methylase
MRGSPYPGRRLTSVAEVDSALRQAGNARQSSEALFLQELRSFWMDCAPPPAYDPESREYREYWWRVHEKISSRSYDPSNEDFDFDIAYHTEHPYPYCTSDPTIVGLHLIAIGHIIRSLELPKGASILEMGAGWGNTSLILAQMGYRVTAVDINNRYGQLIAERARRLNVEVEFWNLPYEEAVLQQRAFDCVLFFESFHHCYDHISLLEAMPRLLKKRGVLALAGEPMNDALPYEWGLNPAGEALWQIRTHGWFELVFRETYLVNLLRKKGFTVVKFTCDETATGTTLVCKLAPAKENG